MYLFNRLFSDAELEEVLHKIAKDKLPSVNIDTPQNNRVVFIDNFGYDNRGLTQQYLRGLIALNKEILFVLHNQSPNGRSEIIRELKEYDKAQIRIYTTTKTNYIDIAGKILTDIQSFSPKDILLHLGPKDVTSLLAVANISGVVKYNINLTDHAYWLGATFIDYNFEFRGYGELLSLQKRGLKQSQLIRLPYYPIVSKYTKFQGFPKLPEDCVKIFCGGQEYKMLGKDDIFFRMMEGILDQSPKAHILIAGMTENSVVGKKVEGMRNTSRVHFIGDRKDINDVYVHSDIFLGTYPFAGGLMTQYAAHNKLPILAYADKDDPSNVESLINHFASPLRTRHSLEELFAYAKALIESPELRASEGQKCYEAMMSFEKFYPLLDKALTQHTTNLTWNLDQPEYENHFKWYLELDNKYGHPAIKEVFSQIRLGIIPILPSSLSVILEHIKECFKRKYLGK
jgi:hypothetical protein